MMKKVMGAFNLSFVGFFLGFVSSIRAAQPPQPQGGASPQGNPQRDEKGEVKSEGSQDVDPETRSLEEGLVVYPASPPRQIPPGSQPSSDNQPSNSQTSSHEAWPGAGTFTGGMEDSNQPLSKSSPEKIVTETPFRSTSQGSQGPQPGNPGEAGDLDLKQVMETLNQIHQKIGSLQKNHSHPNSSNVIQSLATLQKNLNQSTSQTLAERLHTLLQKIQQMIQKVEQAQGQSAQSIFRKLDLLEERRQQYEGRIMGFLEKIGRLEKAMSQLEERFQGVHSVIQGLQGKGGADIPKILSVHSMALKNTLDAIAQLHHDMVFIKKVLDGFKFTMNTVIKGRKNKNIVVPSSKNHGQDVQVSFSDVFNAALQAEKNREDVQEIQEVAEKIS